MRFGLASLVMLMATPSLAATAPPPPPACAAPENRQLDFWVGDWNASWANFPGTPAGTGTNHITKAYDGCVIEERFDGGGLQGHSVSTYWTASKDWRQLWVDNQGGYIPLSGGPQPNGDFVLTTEKRPNGRISRMIFTDIRSGSFTWRWQSSTDGKTWADAWVIRYTRKKGA